MTEALSPIRETWDAEDANVEEAVDDAVRDVAAALAAEIDGLPRRPGTAVRHIRTADACYHVRGGLIATDPAAAPTILVVVERRDPEPPSEDELRRIFGLTRKEAKVARLLAVGRSNIEIATELSISPHTARHHTENVMVKLGTNTRDRVRAIVQEAVLRDA